MSLSRRQLFGAGSGLCSVFLGQSTKAQAAALPAKRKELEDLSEVFAYGVASGDPLSDRVILWTHVENQGFELVSVEWQVSLDPLFIEVVSLGENFAMDANDFTLKVDVILPKPDTTYYYRFRAHGYWSPVGRTKTAPLSSENLRIAVVSCSSIWSGYFNAYELLSRRSDLDLIVHCGDYIYDAPDKDELRNLSFRTINQKEPASLSEHRQRYRYYRLDPHLRAAHQQHPWAVVWDNHDICTAAPRESAIQAFMEWIPIRSVPQTDKIYRSLDFGGLLKVILLDTRHIGRGQMIPGTLYPSILGEEQFSWLKDELKASTSQWTLVVNQVLLSPFRAFGKPLSLDAWEGFPKDRERLLRFLADEGIQNTIVVSGDAHFSYACNLEIDGKKTGVEFLPTSITRGNLDESLHSFLAGLVKGTFETAVKAFNPLTRYFESESHGYGLVDFKRESANCEFWYVDHQEQARDERCARALNIRSGANYFTDENTGPSNDKPYSPALAPAEERLFGKGFEAGGQGGDSFDGLERLKKSSRLSSIRLRGDTRVRSIGCTYAEGWSWIKGGGTGKELTLELGLDEYLRTMTVGLGSDGGKVQVFFIKLVTSLGRILELGKRTPNTVTFEAPSGRHIVSFFGRSGQSLDKIGPIYAPDFDGSPS